MLDNPTLLLVDNGSIKPAATLQLRKIAKQLGNKINQKIHPVSLQHADVVLVSFLREHLEQGNNNFVILPLFFGNSRALTKFIPDVQAELEKIFGAFNLKVADTLFPTPESDTRVVNIIFDNIQMVTKKTSLKLKNIVLVDHGSPSPEITAVRNGVAEQVQKKLGEDVQLEQAVMERRSGTQYDFNGELLEDWLITKAQQGKAGENTSVIVALLFSLPGRHAGEGGDIETICESVMRRYPDFKIRVSPLVGEHPLLLEILADRLNVYKGSLS